MYFVITAIGNQPNTCFMLVLLVHIGTFDRFSDLAAQNQAIKYDWLTVTVYCLSVWPTVGTNSRVSNTVIVQQLNLVITTCVLGFRWTTVRQAKFQPNRQWCLVHSVYRFLPHYDLTLMYDMLTDQVRRS